MDTETLAQCAYEVKQAARMRQSTKEARKRLYNDIYLDYFEKFPSALYDDQKDRLVQYEAAFVRRFLKQRDTVIEIGPGSCALAFALAPFVKTVIGVDVADQIVDRRRPSNFSLLISDGINLPNDTGSADLIISNELIEHLHVDDARDQMREAYRVLKQGGSYLCGTPNVICGPHDCGNLSPDYPCPIEHGVYLTNGLHMKEYTNRSLAELFSSCGFKRVVPYVGMRGHYVAVPLPLMLGIERLCKLIPIKWRSRSRLLRALIGVRMQAVK